MGGEGMLTRVITSVVALAVFAIVLAAPPLVFQCAVGVVILAMLYEATQVMTKSKSIKAVSYISGLAITVATILGNMEPALILAVALFMIVSVFKHGESSHKEVFATGFMTMYISAFMSCASVLYKEYGIVPMLIIFICAWSTDTGAYFAGSAWGKHKLIPKVSPKKTVEGSLGGIVTAMLCCMLYMFIITAMGYNIPGFYGFWGYAMIGAVGVVASVVSQLGDLTASAIKRDCGVKDYGKIFPGHGGFLDRFDSVIIIAPLIYYIIHAVSALG